MQILSLFDRMINNIENFRFSPTCVDVFLSNVLCINCHAQPQMCPGRCTEVFIGCVSPLSQSIAQLQTSFRLILCKTICYMHTYNMCICSTIMFGEWFIFKDRWKIFGELLLVTLENKNCLINHLTLVW